MIYLLPLKNAPKQDNLTAKDIAFLQQHFEVTNYEVVFDGYGLDWTKIDEIEVVEAARSKSPAGWFVRNVLYGGDIRYHIGIYSGRNEIVLPNLNTETAKYILATIGYYLRDRVKYTGPQALAITVEA
jgi:hypothetical protein